MDVVLPLPASSTGPAYQRLAEAIRAAILEGRFRAGDRLPASRGLARTHAMARNTVIDAYEQLTAEGYLETRRGSGTYVARQLPDRSFEAPPPARANGMSTQPPEPAAELRLSPFGMRVITGQAPILMGRSTDNAPQEFRYGTPSLDEFPLDVWKTLTKRVFEYQPEDLLRYGTSTGLPALRQALARYLQRARGVHCSADDIVIVNGSQQALDLAARVLIGPGDTVAVEEPCYQGAREVFAANGACLAPVRVDAAGMVVSEAPAGARAVYVTPSHQFPTGAVMSIGRRLDLLRWATANNAVIIEDDYDSEFRYEGRPVGALQGLDEAGRVIYTGTMSKVLSPALRLGYLVAPPQLREAITAAKWLTDRHAALPYQAVLALFIEEGYFERHLRRMRKVYSARRQTMMAAFAEQFGERATIAGTESGLHILVQVPDIADERAFIAEAQRRGVGVSSARDCYLNPPRSGATLIMGYSSVDEAGIRTGIEKLARIRC